MEKDCYLVLEDGSIYPGRGFGQIPPDASDLSSRQIDTLPAGEIIFNTGMTGYPEILTDPSYRGQIIVMTYPHIGNYGTEEDWSESGPQSPEGKNRIRASGLVVRSLYQGPVSPGRSSLDDFLKKYHIPGISDVDTREITLKLRQQGSLSGIIVKGSDQEQEEIKRLCLEYLKTFPRMEGRNLVSGFGVKMPVVFNPKGRPHICIMDCGVKEGIIRELMNIGCKVTVVPNSIPEEDLLSTRPDGILMANGPGDPSVLGDLVNMAISLIGKKPLFGICLGHQIISQALGAGIFKMKFGHHGVNNPVRDENTGIVLVTSQNHGFAVDESTLPPEVEICYRNANDKTIEGIVHNKLPVLTTQFHPEAAPGPRDSIKIFNDFINLIG